MGSSFFGSMMRRPSRDDGLASLSDVEAGFSQNFPPSSKSSGCNAFKRRNTFRVLPSSTPSSRSAIFCDSRCEESHYKHPYFLEACFLCKKPLGDNNDIFMYRGDTPFCSEECRQEQIEIDETKEKEKRWNLSSSMKVIRKDHNKSNSTSKTQKYPVRAGAIAAA